MVEGNRNLSLGLVGLLVYLSKMKDFHALSVLLLCLKCHTLAFPQPLLPSGQSECLLNDSLKEQVLQLQKDLKNDTALRQELGRSIELLKLNLGDEISSLEERLRDERERHSATKEAAIRLEQVE